jgi:uncharacterized delta-60 repeat protein
MKRIILALMFLLAFTSFLSLNAQWARTYGGNSYDYAHSFQQTSDGGYIIAGNTSSFNTGYDDDIWILKLSSDGEIEWQKTYGGDKSDSVSFIQQTSDGGYIIAGNTSSFNTGYDDDIWILKLSSDGDIEWQKTYGGDKSDSISFIQQTSDGGYIVAGSTDSFGAGESDIWFLKLSSDGDIEWQKTYGGDKSDSISFIQQTGDGGYIAAGSTGSSGAGEIDIWFLKLSSDGAIEWQKTYGGDKSDSVSFIQQTGDRGYIVAGSTGSFGAEGSDFWILKLSSDGAIEWQKTYVGDKSYSASFIQQTGDGGYIVAGSAYSGGEWGGNSEGYIWILKLSSTGAIEWQKTYGGSGREEAHSLQQTIDGGYIVAGSTESSEDDWCDDYNSLILKLSSDGDIEWQKTYGGNYSRDVADFIQQTGDGGYIVAGETYSWGIEREIWVLKLLPNGDINPRCAFITSFNAEVSDTDIMPEDTNITPGDMNITSVDTSITPQDTDITAQNSDANVYNLCSETCTLTLSITSGGTIEPAPGTHVYETGTEVRLKANASGEYNFSMWSGNVVCDKSTIKINMDGDKTIKASFDIPQEWSGGDGGCFIAEAAYGSPLHPHVKILRNFRDTCLMPSELGRAFIKLYYKYSPFAANFIAKHKALKIAVRISLLPLIAVSYTTLCFGPTITVAVLIFIFMIPVFFVWRYQRKLKCHMRRKK